MSIQRLIYIASASLFVMAGCFPATRDTTVPATGATASTRTSSPSRSSSASDRERIVSAYNSTALSSSRRTLLQTAEQWLGVGYRYGGNTQAGVDCSGFVCQVFKAIDRKLPRTSRDQSNVGAIISIESALPGDLVFFNTSGSGVSHVGMLINNREFVHSSTARGVIVSGLDETYYRQRLVSIKRVLIDDIVDGG